MIQLAILVLVAVQIINAEECVDAKGAVGPAELEAGYKFYPEMTWIAFYDSQAENALGNYSCVGHVRTLFQAKQNSSITIRRFFITKFNTVSKKWESEVLYYYPDSFTGGDGWVGADADAKPNQSVVYRIVYDDGKLRSTYNTFFQDDSRKECKRDTVRIAVDANEKVTPDQITKGVEESKKAGILHDQSKYYIIPQEDCPPGRPVENNSA